MLKRHFKDKLFLLLCHWDVHLPIHVWESEINTSVDENTILAEVCILQVLLINLHFKEKKQTNKKNDDKRSNRVFWSPLFFRWYESRIQ